MESQFSEYQQKADREIEQLNSIVQTKEMELLELQRRLDKQRGTGTHTSGFSQYHPNHSLANSDAESVRTQLDALTQTLEEERTKSNNVISEQINELEEAKKKSMEGQEQALKMRTRMVELQSELEQTIKRIEQIQRGGGGYGARANRQMNFGGSGSRNSSLNSNTRSNNSQPRVNRYANNNNQNRPVPSYMRPKGQNSSDRYGSGARNTSGNRSGSYNRNERFVPKNYVPPHLRGSGNSGTRVSPARQQ